jgi:hypothetical protein
MSLHPNIFYVWDCFAYISEWNQRRKKNNDISNYSGSHYPLGASASAACHFMPNCTGVQDKAGAGKEETKKMGTSVRISSTNAESKSVWARLIRYLTSHTSCKSDGMCGEHILRGLNELMGLDSGKATGATSNDSHSLCRLWTSRWYFGETLCGWKYSVLPGNRPIPSQMIPHVFRHFSEAPFARPP